MLGEAELSATNYLPREGVVAVLGTYLGRYDITDYD